MRAHAISIQQASISSLKKLDADGKRALEYCTNRLRTPLTRQFGHRALSRKVKEGNANG